jgi:hypothetical protein
VVGGASILGRPRENYPRRVTRVASILVLAVLVGSCGGDGGSTLTPELERYYDVIVDSDSSSVASEDERICIARRLVTTLGLDRLEAIGTPDHWRDGEFVMAGEDAEVGARIFLDCAGETLASDLAEDFAEGLSLDVAADARECMVQVVVSSDAMFDLLVVGLSGSVGAEHQTALLDDFFHSDPCMVDVVRDSLLAGVSDRLVERALTDAEVECLKGVFTDAAIGDWTEAVVEDGIAAAGDAFLNSTTAAAFACIT